jgi:hypothetical protein
MQEGTPAQERGQAALPSSPAAVTEPERVLSELYNETGPEQDSATAAMLAAPAIPK